MENSAQSERVLSHCELHEKNDGLHHRQPWKGTSIIHYMERTTVYGLEQ